MDQQAHAKHGGQHGHEHHHHGHDHGHDHDGGHDHGHPTPGGHVVAVAADDDGANVGEAADVLGGVEAELDVGAVLRRCAGREQLDQLDGVLEQGVAVAAEELPVAVGAVDGDRAEGRAEFDKRLHVDQRLLGLEAVVLLGVGAFAVPGLEHAGVQVLEIPVHGDRATVVVVVDAHSPLPGGYVEFIVLPPGVVTLFHQVGARRVASSD